MAEETKKETLEANYLEQIAELKAKMETMVPGEEYNKVLAEHKRLTDDYINKRPAPTNETHAYTKEDLEKFSRELANASNKTNRAYVELSLKHRKAMLDVFDKDPFGLNGQKSQEAEQAAQFFETMLEEAKTDTQFRMLMDQQIYDDPVVMQKIRSARQISKK